MVNLKSQLWKKSVAFTDMFAMDYRALILFRVCLGSFVLLDLVFRALELPEFYTDAGVLPSWALIRYFLSPEQVTFHVSNGSLLFQYFLFIAQALLCIGVIIGYRTKLCLLLLYVFVMSLHNRNLIINDVGDWFLSAIVFYSLFLPLNGPSVQDAEKSTHFKGLASFAYIFQICMIYTAAAFFKNHPAWHTDGTAILYSLHLDYYVSPWVAQFRQYPELLKIATIGVYYFEMIGPLLVLLLSRFAQIKTLIILLFVGFHISIAIIFNFYILTIFCILAWIPFLPSKVFTSFNSLKELVKFLTLPIKQKFETGISCNSSPIFKWFERVVLLWTIVCATTVNIFAGLSKGDKLPQFFYDYLRAIHVEQNWHMFAPQPYTVDGWYVIEGELDDGTTIDLLTNKPVTWDKPPDVRGTFQSPRWNNYLLCIWDWHGDLTNPDADPMFYFADYLCNQWYLADEQQSSLRNINIYFMEEPTQLNVDHPPPNRVVLWEHQCYTY